MTVTTDGQRAADATADGQPPAPQRANRPARAHGRAPRIGAAGAVVVVTVLAMSSLLAEVIRPDVWLVTDFGAVLQAPSLTHPLGTDEVGRDLLALVLRGMRVSFAVSLLAAGAALLVGTAVGVVAGAIGGRVDGVLMRIVDFLSSQSHLLFGILIAVLARPVVGGAGAVLIAVALTHWMLLARLLRSEVLSIRERPFMLSAVNVGATRWQLVRRHVLPHLAPSAGLGFVLLFPHAIFHEAALSFLGVGLPPTQPSLGTLIAVGQRALFTGAWWVVLFPGLVIIIASVAVGTLGEWWRDRSQPRWRAELEL